MEQHVRQHICSGLRLGSWQLSLPTVQSSHYRTEIRPVALKQIPLPHIIHRAHSVVGMGNTLSSFSIGG